jgi:antirestriction protein ArdC
MKIEQAKEVATKALDELRESLERGHSETLRDNLAVMARFHRYSLSNVLMILAQRPDATRVAGYRRWLALKRHVRRGARGISIVAPLIHRTVSQNACGVETTEETVAGFRGAVVFDVSDTSGNPLPELSRFEGDPSEYIERLKALAAERGFSIEYSAAISPAQGECSPGKIVLLPGLSAAEEFHTLAHELAHGRLHFPTRRGETTKKVRETEAEAVAFVVSQAIGLRTNSASSDYVKLYSGDKETLVESLERIQETAAEILAVITAERRALVPATVHVA